MRRGGGGRGVGQGRWAPQWARRLRGWVTNLLEQLRFRRHRPLDGNTLSEWDREATDEGAIAQEDIDPPLPEVRDDECVTMAREDTSATGAQLARPREIGRASCRERVTHR